VVALVVVCTGELSPKFQKYLATVPSGSVLAAPLKFTVREEGPDDGIAVKLAVGS